MMRNSSKKTILASLVSKLLTASYADGAVTTAGATANGGVVFTDAIRAVYSKEIEYQALPVMRFYQFAKRKTELGVDRGLTITMLTYDNLKLGGALDEMVDMKTQALSGSTKSITVTEYGNATSASEKLIQSSFDDIMAESTQLLGRDYAMVVDRELRDAALSTTNVVYAGKKTARKDLTATDILNVAAIKDAVEILSTADAPKYAGTNWICFVHPHQSRTLRDDPAWINASNYGAPTQLFTGEIGRIDDVRFIETTMMCNGAAAEGSVSYDETLKEGETDTDGNTNGVNVYQAVLFGDAYYAMAISLPVELRDNGVEDFGRRRSLAWYSIFGVGLLHENYGVVIETA